MPSAPDTSLSSRARLLEAAIICFSEKGFDGTGIREIAQKAQANSALVQYHFGGKEGLYSAALKFIFERRPLILPQPPQAGHSPGARDRAIQGIRDILRHLVQELMKSSAETPLDQAALVLVTREMQNPRSEAFTLMLERIRPYIDHLEACLRVLRPDLDRNGTLDMAVSVYGPIFHMHSNLGLVRIMRGDPGFPGEAQDLERLVEHFTEFSLRGIGLPEPPSNAPL